MRLDDRIDVEQHAIVNAFLQRAHTIRTERKSFVFRYPSAESWIASWREIYGPMAKAFQALDPAGQEALRADLISVAEGASRSSHAMVVPGEYLQVVMTRL